MRQRHVIPQLHDRGADLGQQAAQQGQRQAEHGAVVAVDAVDERRRVAVDREAARHPQRLVGGEVGVDLGRRWGCRSARGWTPRRWPVRRRRCRSRSGRCGAPRSGRPPRPTRPGPRRPTSGLPRVAPSTSSTESQPTTRASLPAPSRSATAVALRSASVRAPRRSVGPVTSSSSTSLTITSGDSPAARSTPRRAGDAEARTRRRVTPPGSRTPPTTGEPEPHEFWPGTTDPGVVRPGPEAVGSGGGVAGSLAVGLAGGDERRVHPVQRDPPAGGIEVDVDGRPLPTRVHHDHPEEASDQRRPAADARALHRARSWAEIERIRTARPPSATSIARRVFERASSTRW